MKSLSIFLFIIFIADNYSQQAIDYFPQEFGYKWNYRISILDSTNNPIPGTNLVQIDSSISLSDYNGKLAYHILTKTGTEEAIQFLPYLDTNYIHLSGSDGYEYFGVSEIETLLNLVDSTNLVNIIPILALIETVSDWRLVYRFDQNVNQQYEISNFDTTITIDSLELPLRFSTKGKRLQDETLETQIGTFICKKFLITSSINYLIIIPPFPPVAVPLFTTENNIWIAPGNWIVKVFIPSTKIDLEIIELGKYNIPGFSKEIGSPITGIEEDKETQFTFNLEQNYPNPFNPATNIRFNISDAGFVSLKVYDILGNEIAILLSEIKTAGEYEILFDGKNLSSGIYFYKLEFYNNHIGSKNSFTKQMLLIK